MAEAEGVIRFAYELSPTPDARVDAGVLCPLMAWRAVLRRLGLIGQAEDRYGGHAYGNLSARGADSGMAFVITASQTSGLDALCAEGLCRIREFDLERFRVHAEGTRPPSSETLTHAMIYVADPGVRWVFHGHCPEIWQRARDLGLPATGSRIAYGSPRMAHSVASLLANHATRPLVFATRGHRDGVFACGATADGAGTALVNCLARSLVLCAERRIGQQSCYNPPSIDAGSGHQPPPGRGMPPPIATSTAPLAKKNTRQREGNTHPNARGTRR